MFRVETYHNPVQFFKSIKIERDEVHITSIPTLAIYLKRLAKETNAECMWNIWIYHHFYRAIYPKWNSVNNRLRHKQIVRRLITQFPCEDTKTMYVLGKQVKEMTDAFRMWIEMGLEDLKTEPKDTKLERAYALLYKQFLEDPEIVQGLQEIKGSIEEKNLLERLNAYNECYLKGHATSYLGIRRIYIYSMDLLEPSRVSLFYKLDQAGYEVIFRIPDEKDYPNNHECWHSLYEKLVPVSEWVNIQEDDKKTSLLQCFLEGKTGKDLLRPVIKYHEMEQPTSFKRYLKQYPMERQHALYPLNREYVACKVHEVNDYFRDELYHNEAIHHFYDTPLGKFINHLYSLKALEEDFALEYADFIEMMCSGIVTIKGSAGALVNGNRALGVLSDLTSYMEGVKTLNEIVERMESYKLLNSISDEFEELGRSKADRNRVKRYLQNPFRALGYINHSKYDITTNQLYELTLKLKEIINELLLTKAPQKYLVQHVDYLVNYIEESKMIDNDNEIIYEAYQTFIKVMRKDLKQSFIEQIEDMKDYISVKTKITSEEEEEGNVLLVKSLEHLPALCVNGVKEIYLCDLSTKHMNEWIYSRAQISHLISLEDLSKFIQREPEDGKRVQLLKVTHLAEASSYHVQNFIKYSLMQLFTYYEGELHLGWIKNMMPYDTEWYLLGIIRNLSRVENVEEEKEIELNLESQLPKEEPLNISIENLAGELSPLAWQDLKICNKRFYLSNLLNPYPTYLEDFTQRKYFAHLCRLLEDTPGGKEAVKKLVFPLFPRWSDALKQNLIETHYGKKMGIYMSFDNVHFPEELLSIQCFNATKDDIKAMRNRTLDNKINKLREWIECNKGALQVSPSKMCYLCPYQMICQEGRLAIERDS